MTESILFATPMYGGMCTEPFFRSAANAMIELTKAGIEFDWLSEKNESLVHRGRMEMTATFLKTNHSHLFWIDADIEFEPEHVAALWNMQADIAVGVYAMKKPDKQWFAAWKDGKLVTNLDDWEGPEPVDYAGTGFMLISRKAVEGIYEVLQTRSETVDLMVLKIENETGKRLSKEERRFLGEMATMMSAEWEGANGPVPALFMTPIHNGGLESEDYHFCRLAREAGYKVMMDPKVRLGHWGQYRYGT